MCKKVGGTSCPPKNQTGVSGPYALSAGSRLYTQHSRYVLPLARTLPEAGNGTELASYSTTVALSHSHCEEAKKRGTPEERGTKVLARPRCRIRTVYLATKAIAKVVAACV